MGADGSAPRLFPACGCALPVSDAPPDRLSWKGSAVRRPVLIALAAVAGLVSTSLTAAAASADPPEQIVNGTFTSGHAPWWGTGNITLDSSSGELCADIPGGTTNPWDVIIGQDNIPL